MLIESLEGRRLLSASLNTTSGLLTITGTNYRDDVRVNVQSTKLVVTQTTYIPGIYSTPARIITTTQSFDLARVKSLAASLLGGNDSIIVGGPTPTATASPSAVPPPPPITIPTTISGGAGDDVLYGGNGADVIHGNDGNDHIYGRGGADHLYGDDGRDYLNGGAGHDSMYGGAGNDVIDANDGAGGDVVDGGTNSSPMSTAPGDVATVNAGDIVTNVEIVHTV